MLGLSPNEYMENEIYSQLDSSQHKTILDNPAAFTLDPVKSKSFINTSNSNDYMKWYIPMGDQVTNMNFSDNMKWYCALLNHDINAEIQGIQYRSAIEGELQAADTFTSILNADQNTINSKGTSIFYTDDIPIETMRYAGFGLKNTENPINEVNIGAISQGVMYTMPKTPNLKLTMVIENDGYKSTATLGGSTLTNITYTGAPNWVNGGKYMNQFGVGEYYDNSYLDGAKQNGRKSWSLKFSYISDTDLFSSNYMKSNYTETPTDYDSSDLDANNQFEYNMFTDDSFIAQVWNKAYGLPFIFQPDSNNNNPDQFNLCMFDQDSLSINAVAYKTYDISIKIVQVW
tara:strand:- start:6922 stop:7953 length:1032 start_codon:yes stop_codon:yes gene_type:complete